MPAEPDGVIGAPAAELNEERMRAWIGLSILAVGVVHLCFGIVFFGGSLVQTLSHTLFGSVRLLGPSIPATGFWFFVSGILALMLGGLVDRMERLGIALPGFLPWSLAALTLVGCVLMPVSAWWLLIAPVVGMFVRQRRMADCPARSARATG